MKPTQSFGDALAVGLSALCFFHCLILPITITMVPFLVDSFLTKETFHFWMVVMIIPVSVFALTQGCKKHRKLPVLILGITGLLVLLSALLLSENAFGGHGETLLTAVGSTTIAIGHIWNFKLCQRSSKCDCSHADVAPCHESLPS